MPDRCVVCNADLPPKTRRGGMPRKTCSVNCRQRLSHHRRKHQGARPGSTNCIGCGVEVSLVGRHPDGKLVRSDTLWCRPCREKQANRRMLHRYGVTAEQYSEASQVGCEICGSTERKLHIDHDHDCCPGGYTCGECVRGFLCGPCNRAIGMLEENPDRILAAAAYVLKISDVLRSAATTYGGATSRN